MPWTGSAPSQQYTRSDGTRTGSAVNVTADGAGVNNTALLADNRENDFATALSLCLKVDGGTQPSANLPMNTKKFTGMAQGSARTDSLRIDQVQDGDLIYAAVGGTANAIELTTSPTCAPVEGMTIVFIPGSDSTSTVTVDLNGNGAVALQYNAAALSGGEVQAGLPARITHDGTVWQLENSARLADLNALAKTDGNIIVGDGTNWTAESGATARTSLGLGTGDSPQFTGIELGHATDTTLTRSSAGNMAIEGNLVYRAGGTDIPVADGGTGASTASAARTNLGVAQALAQVNALVVTNNSGTPNTSIDIDADDAIIVDTSGNAIRTGAVNLTVACAGTGANGLDTGSLANNTWYYFYIIYNPTTETVAGLASTSATSPTLPSGYTFSYRVGAIRTGGSATFIRIKQVGNRAQYVVVTSSTTPNVPQMTTGASGDPSVPTWTAVATGNYVPPTAVRIQGFAGFAASGTNLIVAPNNDYGAQGSTSNPPPISLAWANNGIMFFPFDWVLESTNVYYASSGAGGLMACTGWTDAVNAI